MNTIFKNRRVISLLLSATLFLSACAPAAVTSAPTAANTSPTTANPAPTNPPASAGSIKIGSKDFTEEFIVAEMYAQLLEKAGFTVERKLNLGGTHIAQTAIVNGDIDLYPEYTSTGLLTVLKMQPIQDPNQIFAAVKK